MTKQALPQIYLVRHGETPWTLTGQHTGLSDLPLTEGGKSEARSLVPRLAGLQFDAVFTSPLLRARQTGELAGFGEATPDPDLHEWDYGDYEGRTSADIHKERPDWQAFRDGFPGGESVAQVGARADRVVTRLRAHGGTILVFSHGHYLRFVAARWLGLPASDARLFYLATAALSILGYEHTTSEPVVRLWNDNRHVTASGRA